MINSKIKWRACAAALTLIASQSGLADPLISEPAQLNIDTTIKYGVPTPTVTWTAASVTLPTNGEDADILGTLTIQRGSTTLPRLAVTVGDCTHADGLIHFSSEDAEQKEQLASIKEESRQTGSDVPGAGTWAHDKMTIGSSAATLTLPIRLTGSPWGGGKYTACVQVWDVTGDR